MCLLGLLITYPEESIVSLLLSRFHDDTSPDTPYSVGLLWTNDQPVAETSTGQQSTLTTDRHPWSLRDSNPKFQEESGRRPTPQTARSIRSAIKDTDSIKSSSIVALQTEIRVFFRKQRH